MIGPAVKVSGLSVTAGGRRILSGIDLEVAAGEVLAILGPNGAGKTTLLKACLGLVRTSAGSVAVLGERVGGLSGSALSRLRRRIGYVAQELTAASEMPLTVREVVAIGRTAQAGLLRPLGRDDWAIVEQWISRLGLASLAGAPYVNLSGGEQRKTLIARAMAHEPELLLLDEPTVHLDLGWREQIVTTLQDLHEELGLTMLLVCHELEVLPPCCRSVAVLDQGVLAALGEPESVLTGPRVASLYGSAITVVHKAGRHAAVPLSMEWPA